MDPLVIILTVVASILSLVLLVVGVQTILVLQQLRKTLEKVNRMTDVVEFSVTKVVTPLSNLGGMMGGMKAGFRMLELFTAFLQKQTNTQIPDGKK
jgi:hypothetical protein